MLKPALSASVLAAVMVAIFWAYKSFLLLPEQSSYSKEPLILDTYDDDDISYLNEARSSSSLPFFSFSKSLEQAAKNHALYLDKHGIISHDETNTKALFTGQNPSIRAINAGHNNSYVSENLSSKQLSLKDSIDGLLSAIYHRFNFLDFSFNEIGYFVHNGIYAYEMSNKQINNLCQNASEFSSTAYLLNLCAQQNKKVPKYAFDSATKPYKPDYIIFPNSKFASLAVFGDEDPDPLPQCDITSPPVSIEFNEHLGDIKLKNFEIFKNGEKLENTLLLSAKNDPNKKLNPRQFALFSLMPFEFGQKYSAKISYESQKGVEILSWDFLTKTPKYEYFIVNDGDVIYVEPFKTYEIYFKPKSCNDALKEYTYIKQNSIKLDIAQSAPNTLRISASAKRGDIIELGINTGSKIKIVVNEKVENSNFAVFAGLWLILSLALFLIFKQLQKR